MIMIYSLLAQGTSKQRISAFNFVQVDTDPRWKHLSTTTPGGNITRTFPNLTQPNQLMKQSQRLIFVGGRLLMVIKANIQLGLVLPSPSCFAATYTFSPAGHKTAELLFTGSDPSSLE